MLRCSRLKNGKMEKGEKESDRERETEGMGMGKRKVEGRLKRSGN